MQRAKISISIDPEDLKNVDRLVQRGVAPSRSKLIQDAVHDKLLRLRRVRLAEEYAKLDRASERAEAESFLVGEPASPDW
jgi:metal-responsive CopG/Arc/MetJ family transcriptional regulator